MRIQFHPEVLKHLQRLPRAELEKALQAIIGLSHDPRPSGVKKLVGSDNDWRVRFGQHRIVYSVDDTAGEVTIFIVANRGDAYRQT